MAKVSLQLLLFVYVCSLVICMPKPPGKPRPKPSPPTPSKGFKEYQNRTIEENANRSKLCYTQQNCILLIVRFDEVVWSVMTFCFSL